MLSRPVLESTEQNLYQFINRSYYIYFSIQIKITKFIIIYVTNHLNIGIYLNVQF